MMPRDPACIACRRLIAADLDRELSASDAAAIAAHLEGCAACRAEREALVALGRTIRETAPYFEAAPDFLADLDRVIAAESARGAASPASDPVSAPVSSPAPVVSLVRPAMGPKMGWAMRWAPPGISLAALAASLMLYLAVPGPGDGLIEEAVANHVRALMADHLTDVASSDRHTVAPWFIGKLDFAPPVHDFADRQFPLIGGRLDYLDHRPVAALAYQHKKHVINLLIAPDDGRGGAGLITEEKRGYTVLRWRRDQLRYYMVSDVNGQDLLTLWHLLQVPEMERE